MPPLQLSRVSGLLVEEEEQKHQDVSLNYKHEPELRSLQKLQS